jgi:enoyl-CoA hydratase
VNYQTINFKQDASGIGLLTVNRPEALNALNKLVMTELGQLFAELSQVPPLKALIITGAGEKAFVAGADIKEMESLTTSQAKDVAEKGQRVFNYLEQFAFPVIAAVNGFALGGGLELALACDWIIASQKAKWGLPEVSLGLIPGYGGTQRLSRLVGKAIAKRVALSGEIFSSEQGLDWGIFTQVTEPDQLLVVAQKQAETLASRAPISIQLTKQLIEQGYDETLSKGLRQEAEFFGKVFATSDHFEGIQAFIQKRPPQFKGE